MLNLFRLSNLPEKKWQPIPLSAGSDLKEYQRLSDIRDDIVEWVKQGNNLYIYSNSFGNGKTSWAIKLLQAYFSRVWAGNCFRRRGIFVSVPEFLVRNREVMDTRDDYYTKLREDMLSCDLVVWDDIASVKLSDYGHQMLLNYLDARTNEQLSNIFTGNVDEEQMYSVVGGRLTSRIWQSSEVIRFINSDKRGVRNG
jgi:DNA replication protein DnaC